MILQIKVLFLIGMSILLKILQKINLNPFLIIVDKIYIKQRYRIKVLLKPIVYLNMLIR